MFCCLMLRQNNVDPSALGRVFCLGCRGPASLRWSSTSRVTRDENQNGARPAGDTFCFSLHSWRRRLILILRLLRTPRQFLLNRLARKHLITHRGVIDEV